MDVTSLARPARAPDNTGCVNSRSGVRVCLGVLVALIVWLAGASVNATPVDADAACGCAAESLEARYRESSAVFEGRILGGQLDPDSQNITFRVSVTDYLRGSGEERYELTTSHSGQCGLPILAGASSVFMLASEQTYVTRCHVPVASTPASIELFAHAVLLVEHDDEARSLELLEGYAQPGTEAQPLLQLLETVSTLDSTLPISVSESQVSIRTFSVQISNDRIVSHDVR